MSESDKEREENLFRQIDDILRGKEFKPKTLASIFNPQLVLPKAKLLVLIIQNDLNDERVRKGLANTLITMLERAIVGVERNEEGSNLALLVMIEKIMDILSDAAFMETEMLLGLLINSQSIEEVMVLRNAPIFKDLNEIWQNQS